MTWHDLGSSPACPATNAWRSASLLFIMLALDGGCSTLRQSEVQIPDWLQTATTLDGQTFPSQRVSWTGFRNPEAPNATGLYLLEPYQRGKIPVVFIHGLVSDPLTWKTVVDNLRADSEIMERYQIWVFRYATGNSYLKSAANLRHMLYQARAMNDAQATDVAFDEMVLIGHSMGGLVAKLQVVSSGDTIWKAISDKPLDDFQLTAETRADVESTVRFEPVPFVRQVVFIATPHRGSEWTEGSLGKIGRRLIEFPETMQDEYVNLMSENTDLGKGTSVRLPTSLDHLAPESPILKATLQLPFAPTVRTHSIIGTGHRSPSGTKGDGVVSTASAQIEGVSSEHLVNATHRGIHHHQSTVTQLRQILITPGMNAMSHASAIE